MARPTKFTKDVVDRLFRGIRMGGTYESACRFAGIDYNTFCNWRDGKFPRVLDDEQKEMKLGFLEALTRAEGDATARALSTIMQAMAQGNAEIALKFLERRWPDEYGQRKVEVTGKDGGPIQFEAQAAKLIEAEARALGIEGADVAELQESFIDYLNNHGGDDE